MAQSICVLIVITLFIKFFAGDANLPSTDEVSPSREITLADLDYYVNTEKGRQVLENEFQMIKEGQRRPWTVAQLPENLNKNRYHDLLAYDETRVILENTQYSDSDYINANYIDGQHRTKEYIATQGPMKNTINDFWRMIWQINSTKIVMLANVIEHGQTKVDKYWPESKDVYGDITVTKVSEYEFPKAQHIVRTFFLQKDTTSNSRTVRHFHFTGWPDLGVPVDILAAISIIEQARKYQPENEAPIVVHCSAGVGRTGTMILADSMIQKAKSEGGMDFPKRLDHMRIQRVDVVEKKEQYFFAHQAAYEFLNGSKTNEYLKNLDNEYRKIDEKFNADSIILTNQKMPLFRKYFSEAFKGEYFMDSRSI